MSASLEFRFRQEYTGEVDLVKFYDRRSESARSAYWSDETTRWLDDWTEADPTEPYSRACGYVLAWLYDQIEDSAWYVTKHDGVHQDAFSGEAELLDDSSIRHDNDKRWLELVAAHPWLDAPKPNESVDPGGTEPMF